MESQEENSGKGQRNLDQKLLPRPTPEGSRPGHTGQLLPVTVRQEKQGCGAWEGRGLGQPTLGLVARLTGGK